MRDGEDEDIAPFFVAASAKIQHVLQIVRMRTKSRRGWNGAHYIEQVMDDEEEEGQEGSREEEWLRNWAPLAADYGNYDPLRAGSIDGTGTLPHDRGIIRAMKSNCMATIITT